ncbi:alkaline phosphatase synthesis transcriptional regulatory protein PhoP [archaeon BMS3Abin16]|nr:alkaline phosphatase synthesis transcriptional regulatory protein PhoP [archaeon BMS3Abin16]GBE56472.1 alkaline phosphatase synthesis transcriptional regulatory protein PhoP [archaeon BMS3Bbin16]
MAKVLVVDDEPDVLEVLRKVLDKHGYETVAAASGEEALEKIGEARPDAVVLDIMMPDLDGWEVSKRIRESKETGDLPIVMLSVLSEKRDRNTSFEYAGADWHVSTPFDTDDLFFILDLAVSGERGQKLENKIWNAIKRDRHMAKILDMINPKILEHDYSFLKK